MVGKYIKSDHPYAFRSGEWAEVIGEGIVTHNGKEREVWIIVFRGKDWYDDAVDVWVKDDDTADYQWKDEK